MQCPLCIDETLDPHIRRGVEIDVCPRCRGVWLDRGELDKMFDDLPPATVTSQAAAKPAARQDVGTRPGKKKDRRRRLSDRLGDVLEEVLDL